MTPVRRPAALALVLTASLALAGCGSSDSSGDQDEPGGAQSSAAGGSGSSPGAGDASPSDRPTAQAVPPLTFVQQPDGSTCYALRGKKTAQVAWFQSPFNVTASGRLVDVAATDADGVTLQVDDTQQVPLAGKAGNVGKVADWPLTRQQVGRFILVRNASDLVDVDLRANQTLLPVLHLEADRGGSVGGFDFTYELSNGRQQTVSYAADLTFPRTCGSNKNNGNKSNNKSNGNGNGGGNG